MSLWKNFWGHLGTILHHKKLVRRYLFRAGLYKQGIMHDWSKYSPVEFFAGVKYYQGGKKSPNHKEKLEKGYSGAWLHHQGRNKHHWQYWMEFFSGGVMVNEVPKKYIKEMVADRIAACMVYQKDKYHPSSALEFLDNGSEKDFMPPETLKTLRKYLTWVAENDLDKALEMVKND